MEERMFYLFNKEKNLLWAKQGNFYTQQLSEAQLFTKEEALGHVNSDCNNNTIFCKQSTIEMTMVYFNYIRLLKKAKKQTKEFQLKLKNIIESL